MREAAVQSLQHIKGQPVNVIDVWFLKPRLFKSTTGRWLCTSTCVDEWRATGNGGTLIEAYEDMKRVIAWRYRLRRVEFDAPSSGDNSGQ